MHAVLWTTLAALIGSSGFSPLLPVDEPAASSCFPFEAPFGVLPDESGPLMDFTPTTLLGLVAGPCVVFPG